MSYIRNMCEHSAPSVPGSHPTSLHEPTTSTMKFAGIATILALVGLALGDAPVPPTDLVIDRTHVPEDCTVTAQAGDSISVHYKGTLFANGNKFDSRYASP
jgi:hypothetical protein